MTEDDAPRWGVWINPFRIPRSWETGGMAARFLLLADVCEALNVTASQAYALVRSGELRALQVGGRNQWRIEASELEAYIQRQYDAVRARIESDAGA